MRKRHEMVSSKFMGRPMHVWAYGHFGMPIVIFPSAAGFAHEWDAHHMLDALAPLINAGKIKLYCPESNVSKTWTHRKGDMSERMEKHKLYEAFVIKELLPQIQVDCGDNDLPLGTAGCSLGGYYAANFALKFPHIFNHAVCMSGRYQMTHFTGGFSNQDVYLNNPLAYVSNLQGKHLERARQTNVSLICGRGAFEEGCIEETIALGNLLEQKEIPCTLDIWGLDSRHDWDWWRRQAKLHFNRIYG